MTAVLPRLGPETEAPRAPRPDGLRARLPHGADRPTWMRLAVVALVLLTGAPALGLAAAAGDVRNGIDAIGTRAAPAVGQAKDLSYQLSDMDAQLANVLLAGSDAGQAALLGAARRQFDQDRVAADGDLQQAIEVAGGDRQVQDQIHRLLDDLGRYQALAGQTMQLDANEHNPAGRPSADVLAVDRQAIATMSDTVAAAATVIGADDIHGERGLLQATYNATLRSIGRAERWLAVLGLALAGGLVLLQLWLRATVRRRVNPGLAVATLIVAAVLIGGMSAFGTASHQLTIAKQDAFDSLVVLSDAKAAGADANADESRYLADPELAAQYEPLFRTAAQQVHTDVATELKNITFAGERAAALRTQSAFDAYQADDARIRAARDAGDLTGAIAIDTSMDPGQSDYDFAQYTAALGHVIDINQHAFDHAIADGRDALAGWNGVLPFGAAALVVALTIIGIWPRLAEYR